MWYRQTDGLLLATEVDLSSTSAVFFLRRLATGFPLKMGSHNAAISDTKNRAFSRYTGHMQSI